MHVCAVRQLFPLPFTPAASCQIGRSVWTTVVWGQPPPSLEPLAVQRGDVYDACTLLTSAVQSQVPALNQYLDTLSPYLFRLNTSVDTVVAAWTRRSIPGRSLPHAALFRAVRKYQAERDSILAAIPVTVTTGVFEVSLASVRDRLSGVCDGVAKGLLALAERWCVDTAALVGKEAAAVRTRVRARCRTVHQAMDVEQFVLTVPGLIARMADTMAEVACVSKELTASFRYDDTRARG